MCTAGQSLVQLGSSWGNGFLRVRLFSKSIAAASLGFVVSASLCDAAKSGVSLEKTEIPVSAKTVSYTDEKARLLDFVHLGRFLDVNKICQQKIADGSAKAYHYQALALSWLYPNQALTAKAVRICRQGLKQYPADSDLAATLAVAYLRNQQWQPALKQSLRVLDAEPRNVPALAVRALCMRRAGREEPGSLLLQRAIAANPGNEEMNMLIVFFARKRNLAEEAYAAFDRWNQLNPRSAVSFAMRGEFEYDDSRQDDALRSFQKAVALNPEYITALYKMGKLYWNRQNWSAACSALLRYQKLGGHNATGIVRLTDSLIRTKQYKEAVRIGLIAIEKFKDKDVRTEEALGLPGFSVLRESSLLVESQVKLAIAYFHTGEIAKASALVKTVLSQHPDNVPALDLSQKMAFKQGNYSHAVAILSQLIVIDRDVQMWYQWRAEAYKKLGDLGKAQNDLAIVDALNKTGRLPETTMSSR